MLGNHNHSAFAKRKTMKIPPRRECHSLVRFPLNAGGPAAHSGSSSLTVARGGVAISPNYDGASPRLLGFFAAWRLQAIGYTAAAVQVALILLAYKAGTWLVSSKGIPLYKDFTCAFTAGLAALYAKRR